jgi:hypothetical protein
MKIEHLKEVRKIRMRCSIEDHKKCIQMVFDPGEVQAGILAIINTLQALPTVDQDLIDSLNSCAGKLYLGMPKTFQDVIEEQLKVVGIELPFSIKEDS